MMPPQIYLQPRACSLNRWPPDP